MTPWPAIDEPLLRERFAMPDDDFWRFYARLMSNVGPRPYEDATLAHAFGYPWDRPVGSYRLEADEVSLLADLPAAERERTIAAYSGPTAGRLPMLAIGSNGAPATLRLKFAHFDAPADRDVLALAGQLHDFDVGPSAHLAPYGSLPATVFASPGTAVRSAVLWLTQAQFVQLTWSEVPYRLGRLEARFAGDEPGTDAGAVLLFASRSGVQAPDGTPLALSAVPAARRTAPALSQQDALDAVARSALGPEGDAEALVRRVFADFGAWAASDAAAQLRATGRPLATERFTSFPAG
ncbi:hypothetical protein [Paraconexibacter sp. AEG42_29]|uniref:hypothetical protein n=1 Tax=Paraconexibacter sp. AEG42_29 TaxID=2997339 RepID=UPI00339D9079